MATREECFKTAAVALGRAVERIMTSTPREAAEAAYKPGGPSIEVLEQMVIEFQAGSAAAREEQE